jgi:hypothetical protein
MNHDAGLTNQDRRRFLQAAAALPVTSCVWSLAAPAAMPDTRWYKLLVQGDQATAVAFGHAAARTGIPVQTIEADVTRLWMDDLYHHWRATPRILGGLMSESATYCLEMFGRDAGMKTIFRAVHRADAGDEAGQLNSLLSRMIAASAEPARHRRVPLDYAPRLTGSHEPLVAWVIAPPTLPRQQHSPAQQLRG